MTEQIKEPSEHNRMAALQLVARQSVTRLAEILDSKDEAIATARKERDEARAEVERFRPAAEAWEAREAQRIAFETFDRDPTPGNHDALTDANMAMLGTGLRARAAKETGA